MHVAKETTLPRAKSFTSIYDFFGSTPFSNILYRNTKQPSKNFSVFQATCGDSVKENFDPSNSMFYTSNRYITSEQYHLLNRDSLKSVTQSTSTLFYDLDDIAKRHSFHILHEINTSNVNLMKIKKVPLNTNGFAGKSEVIVQECATQIKPRLVPLDSIVTNTNKIKSSFPSDAIISSEIFLRDEELTDKKNRYYNHEITDRQQKFWSYAKYRTEYTNPIPEEKKHKKKNRGKRIEDPCPCQLFSYACPCTDKKSLTELAKNSKSHTVADQITSTPKLLPPEKKKETKTSKLKISKKCTTKENKISNTDHENIKIAQNEAPSTKNEAAHTVVDMHTIADLHTVADMNTVADMHTVDVPTTNDPNKNEPASNIKKEICNKKHKTIICPKCKENVEVVLSTSDEEESLKYANSSLYRFKEETFKSLNGFKMKANRHRSYISEDNCNHDPRCELVPVCQILPTDNVFFNHKYIRKSSPKQPKVMRITKACRHHPPCTVVPSCQRANVLKNNCEYIPPCLHRPRCVNLPLCVPWSKNFNYEEPMKVLDDIENVVCPHIPRCKYYPECQYDPIRSTIENQVNTVSQNQNNCGYLNEYQDQFAISKTTCPINVPAITQVVSTTFCSTCDNGKSCQFDGTDLNNNAAITARETKETKETKQCRETNKTASSEAIIYIRDVGCQFKTKFSLKQSDQSKMSGSYELVDMKTGNYYSTVHTLRYEDKFTSPVDVDDSTETSVSVISADCHAHGKRATKRRSEQNSGFVPKLNVTPYVAYATHKARSIASECTSENDYLGDGRVSGHTYGIANFPVKSRKSFLRGKYKKMFSVKRRRKSRVSNHGFVAYTVREPAYNEDT